MHWYHHATPTLKAIYQWPAIKKQIRKDQSVTAFGPFCLICWNPKPILFGRRFQWPRVGSFATLLFFQLIDETLTAEWP